MLDKVEVRSSNRVERNAEIANHGDRFQKNLGQENGRAPIEINTAGMHLLHKRAEQAKIVVRGIAQRCAVGGGLALRADPVAQPATGRGPRASRRLSDGSGKSDQSSKDEIAGGMSEAGEAALRKVIYGMKVAVQFVTPQPYLLDGGAPHLQRGDWLPIMLLPAGAANIRMSSLLARLSPLSLQDTLMRPSDGRAKFHLLTPRPLRSAADYFSVGDPRSKFAVLLVRATAA